MPQVSAPLTDRTALITGGSRGLGRAMAETLAAAGANICLTGRDEASLDRAASEIKDATGKSALTTAGDVTDQGAMEQAVTQCEAEFGGVDILINNAGTGASGLTATADVDAWWSVMEVNVKGPLLMSRLVLPGMLTRGRGHIINIGSYQGISASPGVLPYGMSKSALLRLTDSLAEEVAPQGVIVIALSPGFVRTDMGRQAEQEMATNIPGFDGMDPDFVFEPADIARLVVRVAKGDADDFHGRLLHVRDDLDQLLADKDDILENERFLLRFNF